VNKTIALAEPFCFHITTMHKNSCNIQNVQITTNPTNEKDNDNFSHNWKPPIKPEVLAGQDSNHQWYLHSRLSEIAPRNPWNTNKSNQKNWT